MQYTSIVCVGSVKSRSEAPLGQNIKDMEAMLI